MTNADAIRTKENDALAIMIFELVNGCTCKDCPAFYNCWDNHGNKINEKTFKNCLESIDAWLEQESIWDGNSNEKTI